MDMFEIHVLNNGEDFHKFQADGRISDKAQVTVMSAARAREIHAQLTAVLEGLKPEGMVAWVTKKV